MLGVLVWPGAPWAAAGPMMPEFELAGVGETSTPIRSADFKGKVVLVNFWATWCPPCRQEIPSLVRLQAENSDRGFTVLGISMDKGDPGKVAAFIKTLGVTYPMALGTAEVARAFGAQGAIPFSFLVDVDGAIVKRYPGYTTYEKMAKDISELLE
jgi:peroxiredoxin